MRTLISPLLLVFLSLFAGYVFGRIYTKNGSNLKNIRIIIQRTALLIINPIAFLGAVWIAPIYNLRVITLPLVAAIAILSGGFLSFVYGRAINLERKQIGSLIPVGAFTNIGSIGGIIVFFFLGEAGFSLVALYKLLEELLYYGIGFPVSKSFSDLNQEKDNRLKYLIKDPFILTMVSAISLGLFFNFTGLTRPIWYTDLNRVLIPLATILLLFSIGLAFQFRKMKKNIKHGLAVAFIKSIFVPVIAISFAFFLKLGELENGLMLKVVLILSAMPAGFVSLVPATIYELDIDLSNTAWLATMLSLLYTMPILSILLPLMTG